MAPKRIDRDRPVYMIGVAASLAGMHPQTLRIYERKRLIHPRRSGGNTRLYSDADIERLRLIQQLTQDEGINLAGVERIMRLQNELDRMRAQIDEMRRMLDQAERHLAEETERIHRSYKREIVLVPRGGLIRRER